jgi:hypothetical protein
LIAKLGDARFAQRESAQKQLIEIGVAALDQLKQAASSSDDAEIQRSALVIIDRINDTFPGLVLLYKSYELPLPDKDSPIAVVYDVINSAYQWPPRRGFLVKPSTPGAPPMLLEWCLTNRVYPSDKVEIAQSTDASAEFATLLKHLGGRGKERDAVLLFAIQCQAIGWESTARKLFVLATELAEEETDSAQSFLAKVAWNYWKGQITEERSDWHKVARHLESACRARESLRTPANQSLLDSLKLALVPSKAPPGSVAALVDDLVNRHRTRGSELDREKERILARGFEAIPELIEHLDDARLTRRIRETGGSTGPPRGPAYQQIRQVVSELLRGLSGGDLGDQWTGFPGTATQKASALEWWDRVRKLGEEKYLLSKVFPASVESYAPESALVLVIQHKYPHHLPGLYKTILDKRQELDSSGVAKCLVKSTLDQKQKTELLAYACGNRLLRHRLDALHQLKDLKSDRFLPLLNATLKELPEAHLKPNDNRLEDAFAWLVAQTSDRDTWRNLEAMARRAHARVRRTVLDGLWGSPGDENIEYKVAFLMAFLNDKDMVYSDFGKTELGNVAADKLAC